MDSSKHPSDSGGQIGPNDGGGAEHESHPKIGLHPIDISAATFLDVGVLRCLFITHWQEEGIYWALHYMYNR